MVTTELGVKTTFQSCTDSCTSGKFGAATVSCCQTDDCNSISSATTTTTQKTSTATAATTLGTVSSCWVGIFEKIKFCF